MQGSEVKREVGKGEKNEMCAICVGLKKKRNKKLYTVLSQLGVAYLIVHV
jgi:hypothetical protein